MILCSWENPNPLWSFLDFCWSVDLLGEILWGNVHGVVTKLSTKFGLIWTSFAQDSWIGGLFVGFLDETGQTGGRDQSDRSVSCRAGYSALPVRPLEQTGRCQFWLSTVVIIYWWRKSRWRFQRKWLERDLFVYEERMTKTFDITGYPLVSEVFLTMDYCLKIVANDIS